MVVLKETSKFHVFCYTLVLQPARLHTILLVDFSTDIAGYLIKSFVL